MLKDMDFGVYGKGIDGYVHYSLAMDRIREEEEKRKIREFLKKVDKKYYRPDIKERKSLSEEMVDAAEETGGTIPPLEE